MAHPTETTPPSPIHGVDNFEMFFNGWLLRQQNFGDQLGEALKPENVHDEERHEALIDQVFSHYQQYYQEKSMAARQDVLLFLSPPWFTPFERTFFWIGGFKPTFVFKLLDDSVKDLTGEQARTIEPMKSETGREERELGERMARLQETVASPRLLSLMKRFGRSADSETLSELESAGTELQKGMMAELESADALRGKAARGVLEILSPSQRIKLLAAAAQLQSTARRRGLEWDHEKASASTSTSTSP